MSQSERLPVHRQETEPGEALPGLASHRKLIRAAYAAQSQRSVRMRESELLPAYCRSYRREELSKLQDAPLSPFQWQASQRREALTVKGMLFLTPFLLGLLGILLELSWLRWTGLLTMGLILLCALFILPVQLFRAFQLKRENPSRELHARPHAGEFENDGHVMFSVSSGSSQGRPYLQLIRWEQQYGAHQYHALRCPEGSYRCTMEETIRGEHEHDVSSLAEIKPELEARARELESQASLALREYQDKLRADIERVRQEDRAARESAQALSS